MENSRVRRYSVVDLEYYSSLYGKSQRLCDEFREKNGEIARQFQQIVSRLDDLLNEIKNSNYGLTGSDRYRSRSGAHKRARKLNKRKVH
jgi:hypothetical protein